MIYCLIGPTACGKSSLAMSLAQSGSLGTVEIVSLDSAQIYRGMNIGTAKPSAEEQSRVPHHLIDCRDPHESYSVAQFLRDTQAAIKEIRARGHTPLLVGGTMLYFKALREGIDDLPEVPPEVRTALAKEAAEVGWPALHRRLALVDPLTARRLAPQDAQRISRALEVWTHTGRTLSSFHRGTKDRMALSLDEALSVIALQPEDRRWIHTRIAERFTEMMAAGFLEEVATLKQREELHPELPSLRTVGYRQAWAHLSGQTDQQTFIDQAIAATRQLAKRQITWLRSFHNMTRLDASALSAEAMLRQIRETWTGP
jgi:tRNA dimethylallyltransferase